VSVSPGQTWLVKRTAIRRTLSGPTQRASSNSERASSASLLPSIGEAELAELLPDQPMRRAHDRILLIDFGTI
jgi:hypothetical protein